jgi:hypothetical protein
VTKKNWTLAEEPENSSEKQQSPVAGCKRGEMLPAGMGKASITKARKTRSWAGLIAAPCPMAACAASSEEIPSSRRRTSAASLFVSSEQAPMCIRACPGPGHARGSCGGSIGRAERMGDQEAETAIVLVGKRCTENV